MSEERARRAGAADLAILGALLAVGSVAALPWLTDEGRGWWRARGGDQERAAIGALKMICTAETLFREGDKEGDGTLDYGTLDELGRASLVDAVLASGEKEGYRFEARPSTSTPEFLWKAVANPIEPEGYGGQRRSFAVDWTGVIYYTTGQELEVDDACSIQLLHHCH
jgi:hypothetical protein